MSARDSIRLDYFQIWPTVSVLESKLGNKANVVVRKPIVIISEEV